MTAPTAPSPTAREPKRPRPWTIILAATILATASLAFTAWPLRLTSQPDLVINPSGHVPLSAQVIITTNKPAKIELTVADGGQHTFTVISRNYGRTHHIPILGLRPDTSYTIHAIARGLTGRTTELPNTLSLTMDALPANFPPLQTTTTHPQHMEPGVTLFNVARWEGPQIDTSFGLIIAVDEQGQVIWYYQTDELSVEEVQPLSNGTLAFLAWHGNAQEIDLLGNTVNEWFPARKVSSAPPAVTPVDIDSFHHEIEELPNGNLLTLSTDIRHLDNYPASADNPGALPTSARVIDDIVIEFDRNGAVVNRWSLMDILDPFRLGYDSLNTFWGQLIYGQSDTYDWGHSNAVIYNPDDDSFIVSLRHQDAVVKFDHDGQLAWILGDHAGWNAPWQQYLLNPVGDMTWPYHQHAPSLTSRGTLLLYDNGNHRAIPPHPSVPAEESYSRAVEYRINEKSMTVEQVWSYGGPGSEPFYSPFVSEAEQLPQTDNILITDGGRVQDDQGQQTHNVVAGNHWARIIEITRQQPAEKVFELIIGESGSGSGGGWSVYRSQRIPNVFQQSSAPQ